MTTTSIQHRGASKAVAPSVQIYILSRNRLNYCRQAVASVARQLAPNVHVIISENSEDDSVADQLTQEFPEVRVNRRTPTLSAIDHFNLILSECSADLVVLFHDDDIMGPRYISHMLELYKNHPDAVAIGCNATIIRDDGVTNKAFMGSFAGEAWIDSPEKLLTPYLDLGTRSPAPFPSYMYRRSAIHGLRLKRDQGEKHSDVSFLIDVLQRGSILWTSDQLMHYRFHGENDSHRESVASRLNWLRHIQSTVGISRRSRVIVDFKARYWLRWLQQNLSLRQLTRPWRLSEKERTALVFVSRHLLRSLMTRPEVRQRALRLLRR